MNYFQVQSGEFYTQKKIDLLFSPSFLATSIFWKPRAIFLVLMRLNLTGLQSLSMTHRLLEGRLLTGHLKVI